LFKGQLQSGRETDYYNFVRILGIPAKLNADSGRNPNGIPG
jgi:hypothetical protein